jgi:hypothetical protein
MREIKFTMDEFRHAMRIPEMVEDVWVNAYMTEVVVVVDPDRERQPLKVTEADWYRNYGAAKS